MIEEKTQAEELFDYAVDAAEAAGIISKGDVVVLTAGVPLGVSGTTNLIKVQVAAIGLVIRMGASTGGMDIPPLILNKYFKIPVSSSIYVFDMLILLLQVFHSTGEQVLYGILLVIVYSAVLDKCLMLGTTKMQIKVVSSHIDEIRTVVLKDIDRGVTLLNSETGFLRNNTMMLLTVVSMRELAKTEKLIHEVDPDAFVVINKVSEVSGRGFSSKKRYLKQTGDVEG